MIYDNIVGLFYLERVIDGCKLFILFKVLKYILFEFLENEFMLN